MADDSWSLLGESWGDDNIAVAREGHGVGTVIRTGRAEATLLIQGDEVDSQLPAVRNLGSDAAYRLSASLGWVESLSHQLDDKKSAAITHDVLAETRCARRAHFIVLILSAADDRRIAHATW